MRVFRAWTAALAGLAILGMAQTAEAVPMTNAFDMPAFAGGGFKEQASVLEVTVNNGDASAANTDSPRSAFDFTFISIEGEPLPLSRFEGKVVMVVNTASRCGFTHQYADLQSVWERYRDSGLVLLGVPSNDFGGQEPGSEAEIKQFCEVNFNVDFPLTEKVRVKGEDAHPFYRWASEELGASANPRWNFHKYLIGPDGQLVDWFSTATSPTSEEVTGAIEAQLAKARPVEADS